MPINRRESAYSTVLHPIIKTTKLFTTVHWTVHPPHLCSNTTKLENVSSTVITPSLHTLQIKHAWLAAQMDNSPRNQPGVVFQHVMILTLLITQLTDVWMYAHNCPIFMDISKSVDSSAPLISTEIIPPDAVLLSVPFSRCCLLITPPTLVSSIAQLTKISLPITSQESASLIAVLDCLHKFNQELAWRLVPRICSHMQTQLLKFVKERVLQHIMQAKSPNSVLLSVLINQSKLILTSISA